MAEMLDKGADPNVRIKKKLWFRRFHDDWVEAAGATPFWRAAEANDLDAMKLLIAHGADPNIATYNDDTPLIVAAGYGFEDQLSTIHPDTRFEVVKYLVNDLHADVSAQDIWRYTPLHGAAYVGNNDMILFLLAHGADIGVRSKGFIESEGQTVFEAPNAKGDTVADMANGPHEHGIQHPETLALLEMLGSENSHNCRSSTCVLATGAGGFGIGTKKPTDAQSDDQKPGQPAKK
jgi:ankyrin repeat protein